MKGVPVNFENEDNHEKAVERIMLAAIRREHQKIAGISALPEAPADESPVTKEMSPLAVVPAPEPDAILMEPLGITGEPEVPVCVNIETPTPSSLEPAELIVTLPP